jgi:hypothetical protein
VLAHTVLAAALKERDPELLVCCAALHAMFVASPACLQESQGSNGKAPVLVVKGLTEGKVSSAEEALALIQQGQDNRKVRGRQGMLGAARVFVLGQRSADCNWELEVALQDRRASRYQRQLRDLTL